MATLAIPVSALGLTLGALYFWVLGSAAQRLFRVSFGRPDFFHRVVIGQIVFVLYFYVRSVFAQHVHILTGILLPISLAEPLAVSFMILALTESSRSSLQQMGRVIKTALWRIRYSLVGVLTIAFLVALRELPREVPLSTDSAQYTFWTKQIALFGMVPHTQFAWGELHFDYPAGFAVLNHGWSAVSSINPMGITAIQTVWQSQLGWLFLAEFAFRTLQLPRSTLGDHGALVRVFALGLLAYYLLMPVGYEKINYMNLGAGRASSFLILSLFVVLIVEFSVKGSRFGYWILVGANLAVLFLVNPALVLLPALLLASTIGRYWILTRFVGWHSVAIKAIAAAPIFLVIFSDPLYYQQFVVGKMPHLPPYNSPVASASVVWPGVIERVSGYFSGRVLDDLSNVILVEFLKPEYLIFLALLLYMAVKLYGRDLFWSPRIQWFRSQLQSLLIISLALVVLLRIGLPQTNATNLLAWYLQINSTQIIQIFVVLFLVSLLLAAPWSRRIRLKSLSLWLVLGLTFGTVIPDRLYDTDLRRNFRNDLPEDDKAIFAHVELLYSRLSQSTGSKPDFEPGSPRILILNEARQLNNENWLFPIAAGNILPLQRRTLPCAFYYFQGSEDYSYENYLKHATEKLDLSWLRARNIVFVYVPSEMSDERKPQWLREYAARPENIETQSGRALLLRL